MFHRNIIVCSTIITSGTLRRNVLYKNTNMANTYTQLHIQFIFAVKYRAAMIRPPWQEQLHKYITGIFRKNKHKMLQINSMPDHIHILIGLNAEQSISSIIQNVKTESSKWINERKLTSAKFSWQTGYGAFSYSKSHFTCRDPLHPATGAASSKAYFFTGIQIISESICNRI